MATNWQDLALNDKGYRDGVDYSLAIRNATSQAEIDALQAERQKKIDAVYNGKDPYTTPTVNTQTGKATTPTNTSAQYGSDWNPQTATLEQTQAYRDLQNQVNNAVFGAQAQQPTIPQQPTQQAPVVQQPVFDVQSIINTQKQAATEVKDKFTTYLDQWLADAQTQAKNAADYAVNQGVAELERAEADAQVQFQNQRDQIDIDEARAKDNQALYAERRGDKGGIGAAQYDAIMATAAKNRLAVNQSQVKLSTDTARQIADLRAQGEFEKADKLLALSQQYLSQLVQLEQWALSYGMDAAQFQASLQQWQAEFEMAQSELTGFYNGAPTLGYQKWQQDLAFQNQQWQYQVNQDQMKQMSSAAETLLAAGIMPSASQLSAMGITSAQAQEYITLAKAAAALKAKSSTGSGGGNEEYEPKLTWPQVKAMIDEGNITSQVLRDYEYYMSESYTGDAQTGSDDFSALKDRMSVIMSEESPAAAEKNIQKLIDENWDSLGAAQQRELLELIQKYGFA